MADIFTKEHYRLLKQSQRELHDLLPVIDNAEACGMDCGDLKQSREELSNRLQAIEQRFFSPPPQ